MQQVQVEAAGGQLCEGKRREGKVESGKRRGGGEGVSSSQVVRGIGRSCWSYEGRCISMGEGRTETESAERQVVMY
jgi:hypothetical protein